MVIMLVLAIGALFVYEGKNSALLSPAVIVCVCVSVISPARVRVVVYCFVSCS